MDLGTALDVLFLGVVEGLTEFLPVSSTGHLLLAAELMNWSGPPGKVFEIVIQLGAILAVCWLYRERLLRAAFGMFRGGAEFRFALNILLAVIPALIVGALLHDFIKAVLFDPWVVAVALIVGGFAIFAIERGAPAPHQRDIETMSPGLALGIGCCQLVSLIPGVSRAGATILGAMMLGTERKTATEFSFFLAIPTMFAATAYDIYKGRNELSFDDAAVIGLGFVVSFVVALVVVRWFIGYVSHQTFIPFAWYRIIVGAVALVALALTR
jgi:undecaprenyl-diphosphatase